jgi:hypothetical protein
LTLKKIIKNNKNITLERFKQMTNNPPIYKLYELLFPSLATLAKKYLGVQASSCAVERMFSIAGHIFSVKRRRLGINYFTKLVLLKLNEEYME